MEDDNKPVVSIVDLSPGNEEWLFGFSKKDIVNCFIFISIIMLIVSGAILYQEYSSVNKSCTKCSQGSLSFNISSLSYLCDGEEFYKYLSGWDYDDRRCLLQTKLSNHPI